MADFPDAPLTPWARLRTGTLGNGLRFVVMPNQHPKTALEAHLQVHVGSTDEDDAEQGLAHYLEHAVFLGTEQYPEFDDIRAVLASWGMAWGSDSNAFTDSRSTVFTFHAPIRAADDAASAGDAGDAMEDDQGHDEGVLEDEEDEEDDAEEDQQPRVLDLSQKSKLLHRHNKAPAVASTTVTTVRKVLEMLAEIVFRPLFLSDRVDNERSVVLSELEMRNAIDYRIFCALYKQIHPNILSERFPIGLREQIETFSPADHKRYHTKWYRPDNVTLYLVGPFDVAETLQDIADVFGVISNPTVPLPTRRAIEHTYQQPPEPFVLFQHDLVTCFTLLINRIHPLSNVRTRSDLLEQLLDTMIQMVISERIHTLHQSSADPPFLEAGWSFTDSYADACGENSFSVATKPGCWREGVVAAIREVQRMVLFGITEFELKRNMGIFLKEARIDAERVDTVESESWVETLRDETSMGHVFFSPVEAYEHYVACRPFVTVEAVNARIAEVLGHIPEVCALSGPGSIFVYAPLVDRNADNAPFTVSQADLLDAVSEAMQGVEPPVDVRVPESLLDQDKLREQLGEAAFVAVPPDATLEPAADSRPDRLVDQPTGIVARNLSNGMRVTYRVTDMEKSACTIRVTVPGGRLLEERSNTIALQLAHRTYTEGGAVGLSDDVVEKWCSIHALDVSAWMGFEDMSMQISFPVNEGSMFPALELLRAYLTQPDFDYNAFERAKRDWLVQLDEADKSIDTKVFNQLMADLIVDDPRFIQTTRDHVRSASLEDAKKALLSHFVPHNMDVVVVGDFDPEQLEAGVLLYLGTIPAAPAPRALPLVEHPEKLHIEFRREKRVSAVHIDDTSDNTTCMMVAPCINQWGRVGGSRAAVPAIDAEREPERAARLQLPLFHSRSMAIALEIINTRLYKEVREKRGLVYGINMTVRYYQLLDGGFAVLSMAPLHARASEAIEATTQVLRDLATQPITQTELDEAADPLVAGITTDFQKNHFWMSLCNNLQQPLSVKNFACVHGITDYYAALSCDDVGFVIHHLLSDFCDTACVCVGTRGKRP